MTTKTIRLLHKWVPLLGWMACIYIFSSRRSVEVSPDGLINFLVFKSLHVIEYSVLFILTYRVVNGGASAKRYWISFLLVLVYAVTDEIHQTFVPSREGRFRDVIIDGIGALLGWISLHLILRTLPSKPKSLLARLLYISKK